MTTVTEFHKKPLSTLNCHSEVNYLLLNFHV